MEEDTRYFLESDVITFILELGMTMKEMVVSWRRRPLMLDLVDGGVICFRWQSGRLCGWAELETGTMGKFVGEFRFVEGMGLDMTLESDLIARPREKLTCAPSMGETRRLILRGSLALRTTDGASEEIKADWTLVALAVEKEEVERRGSQQVLGALKTMERKSNAHPNGKGADHRLDCDDVVMKYLSSWRGEWTSEIIGWIREGDSVVELNNSGKLEVDFALATKNEEESSEVSNSGHKIKICSLLNPGTKPSPSRGSVQSGLRDHFWDLWTQLSGQERDLLVDLSVSHASLADDAVGMIQHKMMPSQSSLVKSELLEKRLISEPRPGRWEINPVIRTYIETFVEEDCIDLSPARQRMVLYFIEKCREMNERGLTGLPENYKIVIGWVQENHDALFEAFDIAIDTLHDPELYERLCYSGSYFFRTICLPLIGPSRLVILLTTGCMGRSGYLVDPSIRKKLYKRLAFCDTKGKAAIADAASTSSVSVDSMDEFSSSKEAELAFALAKVSLELNS